MSSTYEILLAGFGGQGILFAGKAISYSGMKSGCEVSWIPSYGPEMRGGTCNCSVVVSDELIGCPIVTQPNILIAMNGPSYEKFKNTVVTGGRVLVDSSLVTDKSERDDITFTAVPATQLATDNGYPKLANMILVGKLLKDTGFVDYEDFKKSLSDIIPESKKALLETNLKAVDLGYNF